MTVAQLREYLLRFPQEAEVQTDKDWTSDMNDGAKYEAIDACFYYMPAAVTDSPTGVLFINN